ncbi:hypothetical protein [Desulfobacter postgatei]|uniref:hypothetical protein n=1 Tax=Desulfobacter postgatei TaxID=2293 RepID=UPI00259BF1BD|nr:hypothetical protein [uncultured Desulfobacter sp.]
MNMENGNESGLSNDSNEYNFLRSELETNKKFVFERPLLIIGTGMALLGTLYDVKAILFGPIPFLSILYFNLWFTENRLRSSARIVAYIQLVHETKDIISPGWESALRLYRKVNKEGENQVVDTEFDNLEFYSPIFHFHVWLGTFVASAMVFGSLAPNWTALSKILIIMSSVNIISIIVYIITAFKFSVNHVQSEIERDRVRWCEALKKQSAINE